VILELLRFLGAAAILITPGVLFAHWLSLGRCKLERFTHGSCLGLALAVYLSTAISDLDLRFFYPVWAAVGLLSVALCFRKRKVDLAPQSTSDQWALLVLLLVAVAQYGVALPQIVPNGGDPPAGHLIIAEKIQMAQHAASDWLPFADAPINYPPGSYTLIAVLATVSRLPVFTAFKDLMPLLGVLSAAQVCLFTRRVTGNPIAATYAAIAYAAWAPLGGIVFYTSGGLPVQLAMLLFLAMLSAWLEDTSRSSRLAAASILYSGVILAHHHTQVASGIVLISIIGCLLLMRKFRRDAQLLALAMMIAIVLDSFFLIPYFAKIPELLQTNALHNEWQRTVEQILKSFGEIYLVAAVIGAISWARPRCHPALISSCTSLVVVFILCEFVLPLWLSTPGHHRKAPLSPLEFLNDLTFFAAAYVGLAVALLQKHYRIPTAGAIVGMLLVGLSQYNLWRIAAQPPDVTPDYLAACRWIRANTSPDSVVAGNIWAPYLSWRRAPLFPLPDSELTRRGDEMTRHIAAILAGKSPPDSPNMKLVRIVEGPDTSGRPVLWRSPGDLRVVQDWP